MKKFGVSFLNKLEKLFNRLGLGLRDKLISIFLLVKIVPLILLTAIAWRQFMVLGTALKDIAISDSSQALNDNAVQNIERMTTDAAQNVAAFLYSRDDDIRYLAQLTPDADLYRQFATTKTGRVVQPESWVLSGDGTAWVSAESPRPAEDSLRSSNIENNDRDGFRYRPPENFPYKSLPLYDEITYIDLDGNELIKVIAPDSPKTHYPLSAQRQNVALRENTYVKAETYFDQLKSLKPGEIYVSDVIGAYVGSHYIGMYTPDTIAQTAEAREQNLTFSPETQAYAGQENPNGQRFEGIVRWATPVTDTTGNIIGYVTFALNHDHIMEFVDRVTPMNERYTELPSAYDGNYAFIWDYQCRSIAHPRHHSIVGFDPATGDPQIPWLDSSIYEAFLASGQPYKEFIASQPTFALQTRHKTPAPALTAQGLVGLDGRYLNNAPQCTGWMDLTKDGGSGSFYILWSGLYKLTTAAAIPYYTGQYAPSEDNDFSRRGFGFVAIGAGLEDFTRPATETEGRLNIAVQNHLMDTSLQLVGTTGFIIILVVLVAIWVASSLTNNITHLIQGVSRFRAGERQFRFHAEIKDEFGNLADSFDDMADNIVGSVGNPLCIIDWDMNIIYANDLALELFGLPLSKLVGTSYQNVSIYPSPSQFCPITALNNGHEAEVYFLEREGRHFRGTANYFLGKDGERIGYIIITTDVTEMIREQERNEEQRLVLDKIFSASPDLIWLEDANNRFLTVNPRFAATAERPAADFVGKTAEEILPAQLAAIFSRNDTSALKASYPYYTEERVRFADDHEEILDAVRMPLFDTNGSPAGLLGFARDVTARFNIENELRSIQLELEEAVDEANRANQYKGDFLARMSHEIRTPMNAIIGITSIVQRRLESIPTDDEESLTDVKGHMQQIEASSQHLLGLLNDVLDISKIEAGKIDLSEEALDLTRLVQMVSGIIRPRCEEKNIAFHTQFDQFSAPTFAGDSLRLRQVLINLLGNAVKFTPELGTITFRVEQRDHRPGEVLIWFSVTDTGIGISKDLLSTVFQPFEQGDRRITRQYGGTGLGLAISQHIVQLFGGQIQVDSTVGQGSEFSFSIWLKEAGASLMPDAEISDVTNQFTGKRVLLVDDVVINRIIVSSLLENSGLIIDEADDGIAALEAFSQVPPHTYDMILMDVQMPNMDGYEATERIRALDRPDNDIPIIALTANAFREDIDRAISRGMNAHIAKPVEMDKLAQVLFQYLSKK